VTGGGGVIREATTCMACGRLLRDEESKRLRLGPHCRKRLAGLLAPRPRNSRAQRSTGTTADQLALDLDDFDDDEETEDEWFDNDLRIPDPDLRGQGLTARQINTLTDVPLIGSYL
jgi:hypothetical protein